MRWKDMTVRYLVDPASSICSSKRLSHASLSISIIQWNCEWLIKSVIIYLIVPYYMDNCGNSRANTCIILRLLGAVYLLDKKPSWATSSLVIHNNCTNRMALCWRWFIQISALSTFDGRIEAYHGFNGWRRIRVRFRRGSLRDGYHIQGRQQARKLPNPDTGR